MPGLILSRAVWAASRAKMSDVRQALRNSSVGRIARVVYFLGITAFRSGKLPSMSCDTSSTFP